MGRRLCFCSPLPKSILVKMFQNSTLAECAMMAGIPKAPTTIPRQIKRTNRKQAGTSILNLMAEQGKMPKMSWIRRKQNRSISPAKPRLEATDFLSVLVCRTCHNEAIAKFGLTEQQICSSALKPELCLALSVPKALIKNTGDSKTA
jgi:membrane peptidoglycan carboxypeptidase